MNKKVSSKRQYLARLLVTLIVTAAFLILFWAWQTGRLGFRAECIVCPEPPPPPYPILPSVTVLSPNGGECFVPGTSITISWSRFNINHVDVYYQPSGTLGNQSAVTLENMGTSINWVTPSATTTSARIYIEGHSDQSVPEGPGGWLQDQWRALAHGSVLASDTSNASFTIHSECNPPSLSNITATGITFNSAIISWQSNQNSSSFVDYGLTASYGSVAGNGSLVTSHSVSLTGLQSGRIYHYRVRSANSLGRQTISGNRTFVTQSASAPPSPPSPPPPGTPPPSNPPSPSSPSPPSVRSNPGTLPFSRSDRLPPSLNGITAIPGLISFVVNWVTDEESSSFVDYGPSETLENTSGQAESVRSHTVTILNLTPATTYYYRVRSSDSAGNEAISEVLSVQTLGEGSLELPVILEMLINGATVYMRTEGALNDTVSLTPGDLLTIKGSAAPLVSISLFILSQERLYTAVASEIGEWTLDIPTGDFELGEHAIEVSTLGSSGEVTPRLFLASFVVSAASDSSDATQGRQSWVVLVTIGIVILLGGVFFYRKFYQGNNLGGPPTPPAPGGREEAPPEAPQISPPPAAVDEPPESEGDLPIVRRLS